MDENFEIEIRQLISQVIEIEQDKIKLDTSLTKELGVDSMLALEILAILEKKYNIEIKEEELVQLDTLGQTIELVKKHIQEKQHVA